MKITMYVGVSRLKKDYNARDADDLEPRAVTILFPDKMDCYEAIDLASNDSYRQVTVEPVQMEIKV